MKKLTRLVAFVCLSIVALSTLIGCGNSDLRGKTVIKMWSAWNSDIAGSMRKAVEKYNRENTDKIYVQLSNKPLNSYASLIQNTLDAAVSGPDLIMTTDENFRNWASRGGGYFEDLTPYVANDPGRISEIMPAAIGRYYYNYKNMTSKSTDPLLAIPFDVDATTFLYNETCMTDLGIKVISVDEDQIEAFNNGAKDRHGKTKADYGITLDVRARGFDRRKKDGTNMNYLKGTYDSEGKFVPNLQSWPFPEFDSNGKVKEEMIFNNRISMSWDEVEDVGRITSGMNRDSAKKGNDGSVPGYYDGHDSVRPNTDWGYYTEWWFFYGWGVGGDCVKDTTGEGDYVFNVLGTEKKRAVYNKVGTEPDMNVDTQAVDPISGKPIFVDDNGTNTGYNIGENQYVGEVLPTQRSAFERFFYLQKPKAYGGLYLGPRQKTDIGSSTDITFFQQGRMNFFATTKSKLLALTKMKTEKDFKWDVCPPVSYRVYDENGDNLVAKTNVISLNHTSAMGIWKNSVNKEAAYKFLKYYTTGQLQADVADVAVQCSAIPEQMEKYFIKKAETKANYPKNISIFKELAPKEFIIDIYYFPDSAWLWEWANPLNQDFRENDKNLDEFYTYKATSAQKPLNERVNEMLAKLKDTFTK